MADRTKEDIANARVVNNRLASYQGQEEQIWRSSVGGSGGYHPRNTRMTIAVLNGEARIRCHYDPTEFTESFTTEWKIVPITTAGVNPAVFTTAEPRRWSMKLLFNDLGEDSSRDLGAGSARADVDTQLALLRAFALPQIYGQLISGVSLGLQSTNGVSSNSDGLPPPILVVFLINRAFRCVLKELTIVRKAIHPLTRATTRAEADVVFLEYTEATV
jgi:hypothetical protein